MNQMVMALVVDPDDPQLLVAGVWDQVAIGDGIYYSDNGGDTWLKSVGLGDRDEVRDIAFDPIDPQIVYAATNQGLKISFDAGGLILRECRSSSIRWKNSFVCCNYWWFDRRS